MLAIKKERFSGIGSRKTPLNIQNRMVFLARKISKHGLILRSGGAKGADQAFERGYKEELCEIYYKEDATPEALVLAEKFHPKWHKLNDASRNLHGRNGHIVLGKNLDTPVDFIVCWTEDGKIKGGTGQALRMAAHYKIPVFNLYFEDDYNELIGMLAYWDEQVND